MMKFAINFVPQGAQRRTLLELYSEKFGKLLSILAIVQLILFAVISGFCISAKIKLSESNKQIAAKTPRYENYLISVDSIKDLNQKLSEETMIDGESKKVLKAIEAVINITDKKIFFQSLEVSRIRDEHILVIYGLCTQMPNLTTFLSGLKEYKQFKELEPGSIEKTDDGINFSLSLKLAQDE
ncbi:hypothetical protein KAI78_10180 [bacterium]|nr:hypothetical protein [bacterium]